MWYSLNKIYLIISRSYAKLKRLVRQSLAIAENDIILESRYKFSLFQYSVFPIIYLITPLIIINFVFTNIGNLGYWNQQNYILFLFLGYEVNVMRTFANDLPNNLYLEKFWKTFAAMMVSPINRFSILFGKFLAKIILVSAQVAFFLILCAIIYPCDPITFLIEVILLLVFAIIFISIGLFIGAFAISKENIWRLLEFCMFFIILFSALNYPLQLFPDFIQTFIRLNPLYYCIDFLRLVWIENDPIFSLCTHPMHVCVMIVTFILVPFIAVLTFDKVFKKFGIEGY